MSMCNEKTIQIKDKINQLTSDINKLRAELAYWERMRDFEAHQKFMASRKKPA